MACRHRDSNRWLANILPCLPIFALGWPGGLGAGELDTPQSSVSAVSELSPGASDKEAPLPSNGGFSESWRPLMLIPQPLPPQRPSAREPSISAGESSAEAISPPGLPASITVPSEGTAPAARLAWQEPQSLFDRLERFAGEPGASDWAEQAGWLLRQLETAVAVSPGEAVAILRQLDRLADRDNSVAATLDDERLAAELRRTGFAIRRRLVVWRQIISLNRSGMPAEIPDGNPDRLPDRLAECLDRIDVLTTGSPEGAAWRKYLMIDALRQWTAGPRSPDDRLPPELAQQVLQRFARPSLTASQRKFVSTGPLAELRRELQRHTAEPVDLGELLAHIEAYERTGAFDAAGMLARDCLQLSLSPRAARRELARRLETNYRNANLRVAVSQALLDRLMPEREPEYAPVYDRILGVPVRGRSWTSTDVGMRLVPDPNRARLALEINGEVASLTSSTSGPATFFNNSQSIYTARKPLEIGLEGIRLSPAEVEVHDNTTRLRGLRTSLDPIPLVGGLIKGMARWQHQRRRAEADREIKQKVAAKARQRIDSEADARLGELSERLRRRVTEPLIAMALDPRMIRAETTDSRCTVRMRLAGEDQLGGHTPRPSAPPGSLADFQIHETAINNMLGRLGLEGKTLTMPELARHVADKFGFAQPWETDPAQEDLAITFAARDPVSVRLQDGQVVLTLSIARLSRPPQHWDHFQVRAFYRPEVRGRSAELVPDGVIHLTGRRLRMGAQIALRSIFTRAFAVHRAVYLTPERLATDPKLADLAVTQFVIADGWIGVALGPKPTADRFASQQAPSSQPPADSH